MQENEFVQAWMNPDGEENHRIIPPSPGGTILGQYDWYQVACNWQQAIKEELIGLDGHTDSEYMPGLSEIIGTIRRLRDENGRLRDQNAEFRNKLKANDETSCKPAVSTPCDCAGEVEQATKAFIKTIAFLSTKIDELESDK